MLSHQLDFDSWASELQGLLQASVQRERLAKETNDILIAELERARTQISQADVVGQQVCESGDKGGSGSAVEISSVAMERERILSEQVEALKAELDRVRLEGEESNTAAADSNDAGNVRGVLGIKIAMLDSSCLDPLLGSTSRGGFDSGIGARQFAERGRGPPQRAGDIRRPSELGRVHSVGPAARSLVPEGKPSSRYLPLETYPCNVVGLTNL